MPEDSSIPVALARMEGKLDLLGSSMKHLHTELLDHEIRIRHVENAQIAAATHEARIVAVEVAAARPVITPKQFAGWIALGLAAVGTATPFLVIAFT